MNVKLVISEFYNLTLRDIDYKLDDKKHWISLQFAYPEDELFRIGFASDGKKNGSTIMFVNGKEPDQTEFYGTKKKISRDAKISTKDEVINLSDHLYRYIASSAIVEKVVLSEFYEIYNEHDMYRTLSDYKSEGRVPTCGYCFVFLTKDASEINKMWVAVCNTRKEHLEYEVFRIDFYSLQRIEYHLDYKGIVSPNLLSILDMSIRNLQFPPCGNITSLAYFKLKEAEDV